MCCLVGCNGYAITVLFRGPHLFSRLVGCNALLRTYYIKPIFLKSAAFYSLPKAQFCFLITALDFICPVLPSQPESHLHPLPSNMTQKRPANLLFLKPPQLLLLHHSSANCFFFFFIRSLAASHPCPFSDNGVLIVRI
ncbi:hypothetical protein Goshw_019850, partial [Gossypium schwendimanii]|nr:hypothetical protein [Gossypium schwendimanii]